MKNINKITFRLSPVIFAIMYGIVAYFVIYRLIAKGDIFLTYLLNMVYICLVLWLDNKAHKYAERRNDDIKNALYVHMGPASRAMFMLTQGFYLTAMYIFYIVMLILSQVTMIKPDLFPSELGSFFTSLEYGLILVVVFDRLNELLKTDKKWFLKYLTPKSTDNE